MAYGRGDIVKVRQPMPLRNVGRKKIFPFWKYPGRYIVLSQKGDLLLVRAPNRRVITLPTKEVRLVEKAPKKTRRTRKRQTKSASKSRPEVPKEEVKEEVKEEEMKGKD